jgi:RNA polymerase subunit RPABC4/transcription elongation factor Spt4
LYCRSCGKEVSENTKVCLSCGADPFGPGRFCTNCLAEVHATAIHCPKCGYLFKREKEKKPGFVIAIGVLLIVSALLNILWAVAWLGNIFFVGLSLAFIGGFVIWICCFYAFIPIFTAVFEIIYGIRYLNRPTSRGLWVAVLEIVTGIMTMNIFVIIIGIVNVVFMNLDDTNEYINKKISNSGSRSNSARRR